METQPESAMSFGEDLLRLPRDTIPVSSNGVSGRVLHNVTSWNQSDLEESDFEFATYYDYYTYGYINDFTKYAEATLHQPFTILGLILSVVSLMANIISIVAVCQIRKNWNSQMRILISLMASDILVDTTYIVHIINHAHNPLYTPGTGPPNVMRTSRCTYMFLKALNTMALNITLLNILVMAIDHYIAILLPLKKHKVMNRKRCVIMIVIIWVIAFLAGFSDFATPGLDQRVWSVVKPSYNLCDVAYITHFQEEFITFAISFLCAAGISFMYLRIYCEIKGKHPTNIIHNKSIANKKALATTLLILGTFVVCWLPLSTYNIVMIICTRGGYYPHFIYTHYETLMKVDKYLYCLMLFNTLCDPVIYAVRIAEIRTGYLLLWERIRYGNSMDIASLDGRTSRRCSSQASWSNGYAPYPGARRKSSIRLEAVIEMPSINMAELDGLMKKCNSTV